MLARRQVPPCLWLLPGQYWPALFCDVRATVVPFACHWYRDDEQTQHCRRRGSDQQRTTFFFHLDSQTVLQKHPPHLCKDERVKERKTDERMARRVTMKARVATGGGAVRREGHGEVSVESTAGKDVCVVIHM